MYLIKKALKNGKMKVEIMNFTKTRLFSQKEVKASLDFFEKVLIQKKILNSKSARNKLSVAVVSSSEIKKLNRKFLKKNKATDILSFSPLEEGSLGELVLCVEKIKQQAKEHGLSFKEEMSYLLLHGFLHLLGYHHEKGGAQARKMYQIQDEIFNQWLKEFSSHIDL